MEVSLRRLGEADLGFADQVREIAGWNQLRPDWLRFLALEPEGCFLAEVDGRPAGTATTTCHGGAVAWIGMVLVHPDFRRRGVGTVLLKKTIQYLQDERGIPSVKLDATPEGQPLYEKLGFRVEWGLRRWLSKGRSADGVQSLGASDGVFRSAASRELDREIFGVDRIKLLEALARDAFAATTRKDGGFGLSRDGARAIYLGPVIASGPAEGESIVRELIEAAPPDRWIFWDIPDDNPAAVALAESLGFEPVRVLTRMWLGSNDTPGDPARMWALADPALG